MGQSKRNSEVGFEVLTAGGIRIRVFWDLTPYNFLDGYQFTASIFRRIE
jgi:hypothetical protein